MPVVSRISILIDLPKEDAKAFGAGPEEIGRKILETAVVEGYRSGHISRGQVSRILNLSWHKTEEFLARHDCDRHYDLKDLEEDRLNARAIFGRE
jgi:predicted HTH domain antitoxin